MRLRAGTLNHVNRKVRILPILAYSTLTRYGRLNAFTSIESAVEHYEERCVNLARQLSDTKADLQEFEDCSRELQVELEKDMAQMEKAEKDMRIGWEKARGEIEELQVRPSLVSLLLPERTTCGISKSERRY